MIPPDEKARELLFEYYSLIPANTISNAKKCAIKSVNDIIEALSCHQWQNRNEIKEYEQVKQEIEKL